MNPTEELFHRLWTKAVGTSDYEKNEWLALEKALTPVFRPPLPPPPNLPAESTEIARVWIATRDGKSGITSALNLVFAEPATWGYALWDLAEQAAASYAATRDLDVHETLRRIRSTFDAAAAESEAEGIGVVSATVKSIGDAE